MQALLHQVNQRLAQLPLPLAVELPSGQTAGVSNASLALKLRDWHSLTQLARGQIGALATAYVEGRMDLQGSMRDLMQVAARLLPSNPVHAGAAASVGWLRGLRSRAAHTLRQDARQIQFHYDLSDEFYALWLDPRRVYSCAYFREADMSLAQAQQAKLDHICRKLQLRPGQRLLDIGAGWGGLLMWAAEHYGVQATGITLSKHQHAYVTDLIERQRLSGQVRMLLSDWRELSVEQPFDRIASVGMFEHVGKAHMTAYFRAVGQLLQPGGLVLMHGITAGGTQNERLGHGMGEFMEKYIFPGGELMHVSHLLSHMERAGLEMLDTENLRPHYGRTLWSWSDALEAQLPQATEVLRHSVGTRAEPVLRAYRLYLAGCAMCFEQGWISLHQMLAARPAQQFANEVLPGAQSVYPFNRSYMYGGT